MTVGCILTIRCEPCMIGQHPEQRSVHPWAGPEDIAHALRQGHADPTGKPCTCWCSRPPQRIQRRRTARWRMPEGAVYVGRPTRWGNPFNLTDVGRSFPSLSVEECAGFVVNQFRDLIRAGGLLRVPVRGELVTYTYPSLDEIRAELAGRDLVCWCGLNNPCHVDPLLELANGGA